jgi:hypothetical protein
LTVDFWPPERWENTFLLFDYVAQSVLVCCSEPLKHTLCSPRQL